MGAGGQAGRRAGGQAGRRAGRHGGTLAGTLQVAWQHRTLRCLHPAANTFCPAGMHARHVPPWSCLQAVLEKIDAERVDGVFCGNLEVRSAAQSNAACARLFWGCSAVAQGCHSVKCASVVWRRRTVRHGVGIRGRCASTRPVRREPARLPSPSCRVCRRRESFPTARPQHPSCWTSATVRHCSARGWPE